MYVSMKIVIVIFILWHCDVLEGGGGLKLNITMTLWFPQIVWTSTLSGNNFYWYFLYYPCTICFHCRPPRFQCTKKLTNWINRNIMWAKLQGSFRVVRGKERSRKKERRWAKLKIHVWCPEPIRFSGLHNFKLSRATWLTRAVVGHFASGYMWWSGFIYFG